MAHKRYLPPGVDPPPKAERLGSPALYAQRRLMSETGRAESDREGRKKPKTKSVALSKARGRAYDASRMVASVDTSGRTIYKTGKKKTAKRVSGK